MKTAELTGAQLDYWVARAEDQPLTSEWNQGDFIMVGLGGAMRRYSPSADWAEGGPIIEREEIELTRIETLPSLKEWVGTSMFGHEQIGPTPLVAAMRAYVASKFGEVVVGSGVEPLTSRV